MACPKPLGNKFLAGDRVGQLSLCSQALLLPLAPSSPAWSCSSVMVKSSSRFGVVSVNLRSQNFRLIHTCHPELPLPGQQNTWLAARVSANATPCALGVTLFDCGIHTCSHICNMGFT